MQEYTLNIAQSIRAYGTVTVEAATAEDAIKMITLDLIAASFEPHGSSEDLDYQNNAEACITSCEGEDGSEAEIGAYIEVPARAT